MDGLEVQAALNDIFALLRRCNKYIDETMPWALAKDEAKKERLQTVLYNLLESIRIATVLLSAYLPETAEKILNQLNTNERTYETIDTFGKLEVGNKVIEKPEILFARLDEKEVFAKIEASKPVVKEVTPVVEVKEEPKTPEITIEDFAKIEMKVGKVLTCEKHPDASKLLISQVDVGEAEPRQIVSGIAGSYTPGQMIGKLVVVVTNLKEATIRGVKSQGMLLAGRDNGLIGLAEVNGLKPGTKVR